MANVMPLWLLPLLLELCMEAKHAVRLLEADKQAAKEAPREKAVVVEGTQRRSISESE